MVRTFKRRIKIILYNENWQLYKDAIIDYKTTNRSFVRIANLYKEMGIKNNAFMLALINPALQGIDPFSKTLTTLEMASIAVECKVNPFFSSLEKS